MTNLKNVCFKIIGIYQHKFYVSFYQLQILDLTKFSAHILAVDLIQLGDINIVKILKGIMYPL